MFEPTDKPRVFGVAPGADFVRILADDVLARMAGAPPEALARVRILVNTRRMQRRLVEIFSQGPARLLPRIGLVTEIDTLLPGAGLPPPVAPLRRRLEMAELVRALIDRDPGLAPRAAAIDLADSLAALLDEMQSEGVPPEALETVEIGDESAHWARSLAFLSVARTYLDRIAPFGLDAEARRRLGIETIRARWAETPPQTPVIVAGSTGSRAATLMLMQAVARLPQGALVLPGFDRDLPPEVWQALADDRIEDHPQYRFAALLHALDLSPRDVLPLGDAPDAARNRLVSLSLRPAHVTDQWLTEGPALGDLVQATRGLTLIEAPQPGDEALAIAVALREAVETGEIAALITPDRTLTRRVAAALDRWGIVPDDSAGIPLSLTPPGRFLRHVVRLIGKPAAPQDLIPLLKHPLTRSDGDRGPHMLLTQALEVHLRRRSVAAVTRPVLEGFAEKGSDDRRAWAAWLADLLDDLARRPAPNLATTAARHVALAEAIAGGSGGGTGRLWDTEAGRATRQQMQSFLAEEDYKGAFALADYQRLVDRTLAAESLRDPDAARPDVMIWGTLEARVQGAGLVILGGLNDGIWPEQPSPDPWLNRRMRKQLGLLLPERQIGLAAHDYQQAIAAPRVILSRAQRNEESQTVPSRWLNRLTNLLSGLPAQRGGEALKTMRARGDRILALAATLDRPQALRTATPRRPAPAPPADVRPTVYSVTEIQKLIRDPYAVYAQRILRLDALPPLVPLPDARIKGTVYHDVFEDFFALDADFSDADAALDRLSRIARDKLARLVPWPGVRAQWLAQLLRIGPWLVASEQARLADARPLRREVRGLFTVPGTAISIKGKADRIDRLNDGRLVIYDYKTGAPPSDLQVRHYDRQLLIEAVMAEYGAFAETDPAEVSHVAYIGAGRSPDERRIDLVDNGETDFRTVTIARELAQLLTSYASPATGFSARRAMESLNYGYDYDHLARYGEWDESTPVVVERLE